MNEFDEQVNKSERTMIQPTAPQAVTERYVSNLIHNGRNREFDIKLINRELSTHEGVVVGVWFFAEVMPANNITKFQSGCGATPAIAIRRALEKHGVTFR